MTDVGFIGLGAMGRGMASNLVKAGFNVMVHDLSREAAAEHIKAGATWADSAKALAENSDIICTSLPTPADVERVSLGENGLRAGMKAGSTWIDLSTNSVELVRRLHASLLEQGIHFLDAPVSGGPAGAASGKMAIWVGGDKEAFGSAESVLNAMADQVRYIGLIGAGTIAKLVHNVSSSAISAVLVEAFTMGVKAGLDPLQLWAAIRDGAIGRQRTFEKLGTRFLPGKFDPPSFALRLLDKDMKLGLQIAREFEVPMKLCSLVGMEITEAMNRGWEQRDAMSFLLLQQERAGIPPISVDESAIKDVINRA